MTHCTTCGIEVIGMTYVKDGHKVMCEGCFMETLDWQAFNYELDKIFHSTIELLLATLDARDNETSDHSQRVAKYTVLMAEKLGLSKTECSSIYRGALLHDIGKIGIPDHILLKPGILTPEERKEIQKHPVIGYQILKKIDYLSDVSEMVLCHHEKFDGSGYPNNLKGDDIPIGARLFVIADTIDAMTHNRYYRPGVSFQDAKEEIISYSGIHYDPLAVSLFEKCSKDIEDFLHVQFSTNKSKYRLN